MQDQNRQRRQRLEFYHDALRRYWYAPVASFDWEGFVTSDPINKEEAMARTFRPFAPGERWGGAWEYGYFRARVHASAEDLFFSGGPDGERLVYVNGVALGAIDKKHSHVKIPASFGPDLDILVECYAGHGARLENLGPISAEEDPVPPVTAPQRIVEPGVLSHRDEDLFQLTMDVDILVSLLKTLPDRSLRGMNIIRALDDFTHIVNFDLPPEERQKTFREARKALFEVLFAHNGTTAPSAWLVPQSHIDLAWLWTLEETRHKVVRTWANQLALMRDYPSYRFLLCEPILMDMLEKQDPDTYARVMEAYRAGKIEADGVFYVECDTNIPNGESLVRHLLRGKQWFSEHLHTDSRVAWLPDCFGFSGALPQLLRGFHIPYFATQKLLRADPECEPFPWQDFTWEGIDGTRVEAVSFFSYNNMPTPEVLDTRWNINRVQDEDISTLLFPYGYGDGGGGATDELVEYTLRLEDLEGAPRAVPGTLRGYFESVHPRQRADHAWRGELYLPWHRGTYSSQRRGKEAIRRAQEALYLAELVSCLAGQDNRKALSSLWDDLLLAQFHDTAGGAGISRVHEEMESSLFTVRERAQMIAEDRLNEIFPVMGEGESLFNPLPFERTEMADGRFLSLPPCGTVSTAAPAPEIPGNGVRVTPDGGGFLLSNAFVSFRVDEDGGLSSLTDSRNGLSLTEGAGRMNLWRLYENTQCVYDAWELDRDTRRDLIPDAFNCQLDLVSASPACAEIRVTRAFGDSSSAQIIRLTAYSPEIFFITEVDWHCRRKLLQVAFESNLRVRESLHEIQFGCVARPVDRNSRHNADCYESCNQRWSALAEPDRGFAVLNNGIYAVNAEAGTLTLTLLRAPLVPAPDNNIGHHAFTYALVPFDTSFDETRVPELAAALNQPPVRLPGARENRSLLSVKGAMLEAVKPAEDGRGIIFRLYEPFGRHSAAALQTSLSGTWTDCGLAEDRSDPVSPDNIPLKPFEIRSIRLSTDTQT